MKSGFVWVVDAVVVAVGSIGRRPREGLGAWGGTGARCAAEVEVGRVRGAVVVLGVGRGARWGCV